MPPAATGRIVFRSWTVDDLALAQAIFGDPRVTAKVGGPFTDAQVRARLAWEMANERQHGVQYWPFFLADGTPVGCCGLKPREPEKRVHELGFYIRHEHWGRGFATEAGAAVVRHAFDDLGAKGLFAGHHPENHGSRAALLKLGFKYVHDELYPPTGLMHPGYWLEP
jgi:RimJ/RimL family protein N-acetyltransferase